MPSFTKGDVTIQYEEKGSGFPLLVTPGGGLNSVAVSYTHLPLPTSDLV